MDALTQTKILSQLSSRFLDKTSASAENAVKVPVEEFTDRERLSQEKKKFFRDTPLLLGLSTDLPENDSYLATNETGQPLLLTRDAEGRFRAFLNVCRHRGAQIVLCTPLGQSLSHLRSQGRGTSLVGDEAAKVGDRSPALCRNASMEPRANDLCRVEVKDAVVHRHRSEVTMCGA